MTTKIFEPDLRQIDDLAEELSPQAIFTLPVDRVVGRSGVVRNGGDDFDQFRGANFVLDGHAFALRHYRGHPEGTTTLYLPDELSDLSAITARVSHVMHVFQVGRERLFWQRCEDPNY